MNPSRIAGYGQHYRQQLPAVVLILWTGYQCIQFPLLNIPLLLGLTAYLALLLCRPAAWLLVLPIALPLLDLAPWSGRLLIDEFDYLILITLSAALLRGHYVTDIRLHGINMPGTLLVLLFISYLISTVTGFLPYEVMDANAHAGYYSNWNSLRVTKGALEALILLPLLLETVRDDPRRAQQLFFTGLAYGLIATGLAVMWERGFFLDLFHARSIYQIADSLFNLSTGYRATALFSQMHTGGETIDIYISLLWPFSLGLVLTGSNKALKISGLVAMALSLYVITSTFSRGTYLAFAASIAVMALVYIFMHRRHYRASALPVSLYTILSIAVLALAHAYGGMLALLLGIAALTIVVLLAYHHQLAPPWLRMTVLVLFAMALEFALLDTISTNKWKHTQLSTALFVSLPVSLYCIATGYLAGRWAGRHFQIKSTLLYIITIACILVVALPAATGHRMEKRFASVSEDFATRIQHWRDTIRLMHKDPVTTLFGMGTGTFPKAYILADTGDEQIGSYLYSSSSENAYLSLGSGADLKLGQRFQLARYEKLTLTFDARLNSIGSATGLVTVNICQRHLLHSSKHPAKCEKNKIRITPHGDDWARYQAEFTLEGFSRRAWYFSRPLIFMVRNSSSDAVVDIDNISLTDSDRNNLLDNGGFTRGGDRWFPYYDIVHLPWHIKNLWVNLYFEMGIFGLLVFVTVLGCACLYTVRLVRTGDTAAVALLGSIAGFVAISMIGSFDAPRVIWIYYTLLAYIFVKWRLRGGWGMHAPPG